MSSTRSSSPTRAASSGSPDEKQRDVHMLFHAGRCRAIMDAMSAFRILRRGADRFVANAPYCGALPAPLPWRGSSLRRSTCDESARLRSPFLPEKLRSHPLLRLLRSVPGDPRRCGGFHEAACGARCCLRRAERQRAGAGRERSGEEAPREPGSPEARNCRLRSPGGGRKATVCCSAFREAWERGFPGRSFGLANRKYMYIL